MYLYNLRVSMYQLPLTYDRYNLCYIELCPSLLLFELVQAKSVLIQIMSEFSFTIKLLRYLESNKQLPYIEEQLRRSITKKVSKYPSIYLFFRKGNFHMSLYAYQCMNWLISIVNTYFRYFSASFISLILSSPEIIDECIKEVCVKYYPMQST